MPYRNGVIVMLSAAACVSVTVSYCHHMTVLTHLAVCSDSGDSMTSGKFRSGHTGAVAFHGDNNIDLTYEAPPGEPMVSCQR